jgi:acetyltransferase-like isoleucine patch superfamily enzyme
MTDPSLNPTQRIVGVTMGTNVTIRDFVNLYECTIGDDTRIGTFVEIQSGVMIGARCKVSSHTFICEGVTIEDEVFIGHNVSFINDLYPRATDESARPKGKDDWVLSRTLVRARASIGTSATILGGVEIGHGAIVGAGSVVTREVPPRTIVTGNPARVMRSIPDGA